MKDPFVPKTTGIVGQSISDITATFSMLGVKLREQLDKLVLRTGGAWATIAFLFKDFDKDLGDFGGHKVMLATFKSDGEFYKRQSYFIVRDRETAKDVIELLKKWFDL